MSDYSREIAITLNERDLMLYFHLKCVEPSTPPTGMYGPPEWYDPGSPAEFELEHVIVTYTDKNDKEHEAILKPEMFDILCGKEGEVAYELAVEAAQEDGRF